MVKHPITRSLLLSAWLLCLLGLSSGQDTDLEDGYLLPRLRENPWRYSHDLGESQSKNPDLEYDADTGTLSWTLHFPQGGTAVRLLGEERLLWGRATALTAEVYVPRNAPAGLTAQIALRHDVWGWFLAEPTQQLKPGEWNRIHWPLGESSSIWRSLGGSVIWNDTLRRNLSRVALRCFGQEEWEGTLIWKPFALRGIDRELPVLRAENIRRLTPATNAGEKFEIAFDLTRAYDNPYDPRLVAIDVEYIDPDGKSIMLPAFYYQDYSRGRLSNGHETLEAVGKAHWRSRYTPNGPGTHRYIIHINDHYGSTWQSETTAFDVGKKDFPGFVRIDPDDPSWLSFTGGDFYYPLGLIVRSPDDERELYDYEFETPEGRGTYAYDRYFGSMAKAGVNFTRVWMAAWWVAIEWSHGYDSSYPGTGRYNQRNAWRLDYVVDLARKLGIYIDLTLHNHGQFRASNFDQEWYDNAYYRGRGGPVDEPQEFWTDPEARRLMKQRLRYLVGRWGSSPSIAWWELCNEVNLISAYDSNSISRWHNEMAHYINKIDPYRDMTTAHFTAGLFDPSVIGLPSMAVSQSTAYTGDMIERGIQMYRQHGVFRKPVYINEFGVGKSNPLLQSNFHSGLWSSTVMPFCGPALFWWWVWVEGADEYYQFENIRRFQDGEDYRNSDMTLIAPQAVKASPGDRRPLPFAVGMQSTRQARLWVYDPQIYRVEGREPATPIKRAIPEAKIRLDYLGAGKYRLEFWDTWEGKVSYTKEITHGGGEFLLQTPAFERDIAVKIDMME